MHFADLDFVFEFGGFLRRRPRMGKLWNGFRRAELSREHSRPRADPEMKNPEADLQCFWNRVVASFFFARREGCRRRGGGGAGAGPSGSKTPAC